MKKDDFMEYGNKTPKPTFKGFLKTLLVWIGAAIVFIGGMILNGSVKL